MIAYQQIWRTWAHILHRWGINEWVATFLETTGPLTIIGAQVVYIGQPLLESFFPNQHIDALGHILDNKSETSSFISYLREESHQWNH